MKTGEVQWKEKLDKLPIDTTIVVNVGGDTDEVELRTLVEDLFAQTLESLVRELEEKKEREYIEHYTGDFVIEYVSMEDIASVFKKYGVDIGGNGK